MHIRWFERATRKNIWNCDEGRLSMVVNDIRAKYPEVNIDFLWETLLKRGILKWMAVRKDLIGYKYVLKDAIKAIDGEGDARRKRGYVKGRARTLMDCRGAIREMCHSNRWRAPADDPSVIAWLERFGGLTVSSPQSLRG